MEGSATSLMKRTGGPGYIHAEECDRNTHVEVAVVGGATWRDQGTPYDGNVCSGQGFDDIHADQGEGYRQKMGQTERQIEGEGLVR